MVKPKIVTGMVTLCRHTGWAATLHSDYKVLNRTQNYLNKQRLLDTSTNVDRCTANLVCKLIYLENITLVINKLLNRFLYANNINLVCKRVAKN